MFALLPTKTGTFLAGNNDDVSQDNPDDNDVDCRGN